MPRIVAVHPLTSSPGTRALTDEGDDISRQRYNDIEVSSINGATRLHSELPNTMSVDYNISGDVSNKPPYRPGRANSNFPVNPHSKSKQSPHTLDASQMKGAAVYSPFSPNTYSRLVTLQQ